MIRRTAHRSAQKEHEDTAQQQIHTAFTENQKPAQSDQLEWPADLEENSQQRFINTKEAER